MENEKVFIIGDIHGCLDMLKSMMDVIPWRPEKDRLIFLGDYIDRGKDPKGVVDFVLGLNSLSSLVECLIGNHEVMFLDYLSKKHRELFLANGGWNTLESYMTESSKEGFLIPPRHMAFYKSLKTYIELEDFYIVHAGFRPFLDIKKQSLEDMTWIREPFIHSDFDFGKSVIFGHTPFYEPLVTKNKIGLDTGAVFNNRLTCLELPEVKFHSVEA